MDNGGFVRLWAIQFKTKEQDDIRNNGSETGKGRLGKEIRDAELPEEPEGV